MASVEMIGGESEEEKRRRRRWDDNRKVYTRKFHNKRSKNALLLHNAPLTNCGNDEKYSTSQNHISLYQQQQQEINPPPAVSVEVGNSSTNGLIKHVVTRVDDRIRINSQVAHLSKDEIQELRSKFVTELDQVRALVLQLQEKEHQLTAASYSQQLSGGDSGHDVPQRRALLRVNSEVGSVTHFDSPSFRPGSLSATTYNDSRALLRVHSEVGSVVGGGQEYRPFRHLSISVMENNNHIHGVGELIEKEKRTPKANQFYRNSDFLLGKDRLPPESHKKNKSNGGRKHEYGYGLHRYRNQVFKNCSNLLQKLMKHKHGWVFNEPVNAKMLGLHDYHDIIKQPMDLGTIKSRLAQNFYKSPRDFAEDVRLTFRNAMTYNPKGQDVHVMAEQLSDIFEERWVVVDAEYNPEWRYDMIHYSGVPTPTSGNFPPQIHVPTMRALERSESMIRTIDYRPKHSFRAVGRPPVLKKPKAKDPNKRGMTFEEKQKLSTNLQSLPSEKLDNLIQIIKKRNSTLNQHDDEIEVDIDSVDAETLWELDRFITNHKKSLSKNKKKAELAQARAQAGLLAPASKPGPAIMLAPKETKTDEINAATVSPLQPEKQGGDASKSSSSGTSSSDSGSSSTDSDSDSSSADGSDAGHSPRT